MSRSTAETSIFSPVALGAMELANRVVMAPMTRDRAGPGDVPTALMATYYAQRAGAGLIVTEGTQPSPAGKGYWRTPGIHSREQMAGWRGVTDAVHAVGGRIAMQIMHVGRASVRANKAPDADTYAPSALQCPDPIPGPTGAPEAAEIPRALETGEIADVIAEYAAAAANAISVGMDGVELHCASGYLPHQFLSSNTNQRTDRYGGTLDNRIRFVVETLEAIAGAVGAGRVGFRICPGIRFNGIVEADTVDIYTALLAALDGRGLAYVHLNHIPSEPVDPLDLIQRVWKGAVIESGNLRHDTAQAVLDAGRADAVAFGRPFISNPDLVARLRVGAPLARFDRDTFYTGHGDDARGYTDYPVITGATERTA